MAGVDLLDVWRGTLTLRRISVLVDGLPASSATQRALYPETAGYTHGDFLLMDVVDALHGANWQRSGGPGAAPKPMVRPGDTAARDAKADVMAAKAAAFRKRSQQQRGDG